MDVDPKAGVGPIKVREVIAGDGEEDNSAAGVEIIQVRRRSMRCGPELSKQGFDSPTRRRAYACENVFAVPLRTPSPLRNYCLQIRIPTLQLKPWDHSTLGRSGTGRRAKFPNVSRCCIRGFQATDSGRLLCERDRQNVHADDPQIP
jgi:hypothetical protein